MVTNNKLVVKSTTCLGDAPRLWNQAPKSIRQAKTAKKQENTVNHFLFKKIEASYFDQINMTENGLEYDQKKLTPTNVSIGT